MAACCSSGNGQLCLGFPLYINAPVRRDGPVYALRRKALYGGFYVGGYVQSKILGGRPYFGAAAVGIHPDGSRSTGGIRHQRAIRHGRGKGGASPGIG